MRKLVQFFGVCAALLAAPAASAQVYWKSPVFTGAPILPGEPGIGVAMPGATPDEQKASHVWQLRAGLNVMALQCQFDPTMLAENSYNTVIFNHRSELEAAYAKLGGYFRRMHKTPREGQRALDQFNTRTYISLSTVRGQLGFCETASRIARATAFAPRGSLATITSERLRELRNSLILGGEQQFPAYDARALVAMPSFDRRCWDRRGNYNRACGTIPI